MSNNKLKRDTIEVVFNAAFDMELPPIVVGAATEDVREAWAATVLTLVGVARTPEGSTYYHMPATAGEA